ncbi:RnfABCDGE type electron transport complex subunit G [Pseudomonas fakonensis]|uniref:Ion-translocating oxidoreductase complex subunit G n=1 Tax=Pseudomonas fakonensis TaxID=2842355 RepID=A0ABX8N8H5_9PSED|nr:RnfABCDGE type electron transport complex subunit G [Pseudomonas fakonensis]QXH52666.1 RnfABCDGE type electron transport complex subunit G [Pseudomonas fakonensis]
MNARTRSILLLVLVTGLALALSLAWQRATEHPIAEAERQLREQAWLAVLPAGSYDNQPLRTPLPLADTHLGHSRLLAGYRATLAGQAIAILLHSQCQGYAGPIELAIAIAANGRLQGIQVLQQQESPGLGDQLADPARHWLQQFVGKGFSDTPAQAWALKRDQGQFDQLTGATVTSRAVIDATQDALRYFDEHRRSLLAAPADE